MTTNEFIDVVRQRLASAAVTPSAVRNMGAPGVVVAARKFLTDKVLLLNEMASSGERFSELLDLRTNQLVAVLPEGARHWGAARKVLNIFLRDCTYNFLLRQEFRLELVSSRLEVPLDHDVANFLHNNVSPDQVVLPTWTSIKSLKPEQNEAYQRAAKLVASRRGILPVDVDVLAWRQMSGVGSSFSDD